MGGGGIISGLHDKSLRDCGICEGGREKHSMQVIIRIFRRDREQVLLGQSLCAWSLSLDSFVHVHVAIPG